MKQTKRKPKKAVKKTKKRHPKLAIHGTFDEALKATYRPVKPGK